MNPNFDYAAVPERFLLAFLEDIAGYVEKKGGKNAVTR